MSRSSRLVAAPRATLVAAAALACVLPAGALAQSQLEPVFVTGSRTAQPLFTAPIGATVITAEDIRRAGVADVNEAIRKLAGVAARPDLAGGREQTLDLRGYGDAAAQNLVVLVDGLRISENELVNARTTAIPLEQVERIEIVRGGSSVLWGEGATGGVINIVLRQGASRPGVGGSARLALESHAGRDAGAQVQWAGAALSLDAGARSVTSDGERQNSAYRQDTVHAGAGLETELGRLRLRVQRESQGGRLPGSLSFSEFAADPRQTTTPGDFGRVDETRTSLQFTGRTGTWQPVVELMHRERASTAHFAAFAFDSATASRSDELAPRLVHHSRWGDSAETTLVGLQWQHWHYRNTSSGQDETGRQQNHAAFIHSDWALASGTRLAGGWREERVRKQASDSVTGVDYDRSDRLHAGELGASQQLGEHLVLHGRVATAYRLPNVDENRYLSAPLRPQRSRDTELGLRWSEARTSAALRLFRQRTRDEIAYDPTVFSNVNLDPVRRQGVELEARAPVGRVDIAFTWQQLSARFDGGANEEVTLVPRQSGTLRVGLPVAASQRIELGLQYRGESRFGDDQKNACSGRIPASTLLDAHYRAELGDWTVTLTARNLADRHTYSLAYSCTAGGLYPDAGRWLGASVARRF